MRLLRLTLAFFAGTALAAAALPGVAHAADNNSAIAVNTKDGSSVFKVAFSLKRLSDTTVDSQNAAVAFSNCTECQTVAVAIQIVLVVDDPTEVTPTNVAIAYNADCSSCETMAAAYQFVFGVGDDFKFSPEGRQRLHDLRKRLHDLRKSQGLSIEQIDAELQSIVEGIAGVLADELAASTASSTTTSTTVDPSSTSTSTSTTIDRDGTTSTTETTAPATTTSAP